MGPGEIARPPNRSLARRGLALESWLRSSWRRARDAALDGLGDTGNGAAQSGLATLGLETWPDDFDVERASKAGGEDQPRDLVERHRPVPGHRTTGQPTVSQDIVADLHERAERSGRGDGVLEIGVKPAGEDIDPETDAPRSGQRHQIRKAMGERGVDIEVGRGLDRQ